MNSKVDKPGANVTMEDRKLGRYLEITFVGATLAVLGSFTLAGISGPTPWDSFLIQPIPYSVLILGGILFAYGSIMSIIGALFRAFRIVSSWTSR